MCIICVPMILISHSSRLAQDQIHTCYHLPLPHKLLAILLHLGQQSKQRQTFHSKSSSCIHNRCILFKNTVLGNFHLSYLYSINIVPGATLPTTVVVVLRAAVSLSSLGVCVSLPTFGSIHGNLGIYQDAISYLNSDLISVLPPPFFLQPAIS